MLNVAWFACVIVVSFMAGIGWSCLESDMSPWKWRTGFVVLGLLTIGIMALPQWPQPWSQT